MWGSDLQQGFGELRGMYPEEALMALTVKNKLMQRGGPPNWPGLPRYRGGVGAHPDDVWDFSELDSQERKYPQLTVLMKDWMAFLGDHRPPRSWCRTSPDTGYLCEEGYGSTVVYQRPGANAPRWLQRQGDRFRRLIRRLDHTEMIGGANAGKARDAAKLLTVPDAVYSYLPGVLRGRLGSGGPGANWQGVRNLLLHYLPDVEQAPEVTEYLEVLHSEVPYGIETTGLITGLRTGREWYDVLMPAYESLIRKMDDYVRIQHPESSTVAKVHRLRQKMDMPDGVFIPGPNVRMRRGAPGVPPIDLRAWLKEESVSSRTAEARLPAWYFAARDYLELVCDYWADIPRDIRYSGRCENSRNHRTSERGSGRTGQ